MAGEDDFLDVNLREARSTTENKKESQSLLNAFVEGVGNAVGNVVRIVRGSQKYNDNTVGADDKIETASISSTETNTTAFGGSSSEVNIEDNAPVTIVSKNKGTGKTRHDSKILRNIVSKAFGSAKVHIGGDAPAATATKETDIITSKTQNTEKKRYGGKIIRGMISKALGRSAKVSNTTKRDEGHSRG